MTASIRFPFWIFNGRKHQKHIVQRVPQQCSSGLGTAQIGHNASLANGLSAQSYGGTGCYQANIYQSGQMAEGRNKFESNDWSGLSGQSYYFAPNENNSSGLGTQGFIAHDGTPFDDYVGTNGLNTQRVSDFYGDSAQFNCLAANNYGVCGLIGHNGTPTFWKWDNAQGCMVPHVVSTPLIRRFQRSFAAFLSSWRLG